MSGKAISVLICLSKVSLGLGGCWPLSTLEATPPPHRHNIHEWPQVQRLSPSLLAPMSQPTSMVLTVKRSLPLSPSIRSCLYLETSSPASALPTLAIDLSRIVNVVATSFSSRSLSVHQLPYTKALLSPHYVHPAHFLPVACPSFSSSLSALSSSALAKPKSFRIVNTANSSSNLALLSSNNRFCQSLHSLLAGE